MIATHLRNLAYRLLRHPELAAFDEKDYDGTEIARVQKEIYARKPGLQFIYDEYCRPFEESERRGAPGKRSLEIGSGISPLVSHIPGLITSDVVALDGMNVVCSAYRLPFADASLDRIYMTFVLHHLGQAKDFLDEAYRCLKPGGELVIVDSAVTAVSKIYFKFHVDKIDTASAVWGFDGSSRMTDSNLAIAWMIFFRDHEKFERLYPGFVVDKVEYNTCLAFLLSGGLRIRQLLPTFLLKALFIAENWLIRHVTKELANTMAVTVRRT